MKDIIKKYSNGTITVVWQPSKCVHSRICFNGLPQVFDPNVRPWVNINGAETDQILDQVRQCPSEALSYYQNSKADSES